MILFLFKEIFVEIKKDSGQQVSGRQVAGSRQLVDGQQIIAAGRWLAAGI